MLDGITLTEVQYLQKQIDWQKRHYEKLKAHVDDMQKQALIKTRILEEMTTTMGTMADRLENLYDTAPLTKPGHNFPEI